MRQIVFVNWRYIGDAVPAFVTMMTMPFTYSVAYGLIAGIVTYTTVNSLTYLTRIISGGRILTVDEDSKEYWTALPEGNLPWFVRAVKNPKEFFNNEDRIDPHADKSYHSDRTSSSPRVSRHDDKDISSTVFS